MPGPDAAVDTRDAILAPSNQPPMVRVTPSLRLRASTEVATLDGMVTDDGQPSPPRLTSIWSRLAGPGTVTFADPTSAATTARFSAVGMYVLRLTASDGVLSSFADTMVSVLGLDIGLAGWWQFDEGAGAIAKDTSGGVNNGTLVGQVRWVPGKLGTGVAFTASTASLVSVPDPTTERLDFGTDDFSISFSFQSSQQVPAGRFPSLVAKLEGSTTPRFGYEVYAASTPGVPGAHLTFKIWSGAVNAAASISGPAGVNDGRWHAVVTRKTAGLIEIFLDGRREAAAHAVGTISTRAPLEMGGRTATTNTDYEGTLDDVRLYRRAMTDAEVTALSGL